jgi:hypothetical protein
LINLKEEEPEEILIDQPLVEQNSNMKKKLTLKEKLKMAIEAELQIDEDELSEEENQRKMREGIGVIA